MDNILQYNLQENTLINNDTTSKVDNYNNLNFSNDINCQPHFDIGSNNFNLV
jgi:hypothetical protein